MDKIVLVGCGSMKQGGRHPARELTVSHYFKLKLAYAKLLSDKIYILSSRNHLVDLDEALEYYDIPLKKAGKEDLSNWAAEVFDQIKAKGIDVENTEFVFLAGKEYREVLSSLLPHTSCPLAGMRIGQQLKYMNEEIGRA